MGVGPFLGLAEAVLAFDLDVSKRCSRAKRKTLARCGSAAPLVISASLTPINHHLPSTSFDLGC
jgi:hypothetical protein